MKSLSNILCVASCVLILGAMGAPAGAAITFDDFSTDPNIGIQWTEYAYFGSDSVATTWNSTDQDLDLTRPAGQIGQGLYRTGSSRSATDPVTLTVKDLGRTGGTWGFAGLMISTAQQPGYITTGDDTYTLRMNPLSATTFQPMVTRTYLDGTSNFVLYDGGSQTFSGPYTLDIERNGTEYDFKINDAVVYTTGTAAGDTYSTAVKDSMTSYQIVTASDGAMTATLDDFGVPGAGPPPPLGDAYVVNVDVQGGSHAAYAGLGGAPDLPTNTYWNLLNAANGYNATNLFASDGMNVTPIGIRLANGLSTYDAGTEGNTLQSDRIYDHNNPPASDGVGDFTITGLEAGADYDIYIYTNVFETDFTVNGVTKTATGGDAGGPIPTWVEGQHYVLFESVLGGADVLGTYAYTPNSQGFAVLAGFQVAKNAAPVPEPSTVVLLGIGLVALVGFGRRRRRRSGPNL